MGRAREDERELLAAGLGAVGAGVGGRAGGWLTRRVARLMPDDVHEAEIVLPLHWAEAVRRVRTVVGGAGPEVAPAPAPPGDAPRDRVMRVLTGGGFAGMNPVVLTATVVRPSAKDDAGRANGGEARPPGEGEGEGEA
ncbi:hypothetical protein C6N75_28630, partial [Streptomyces solincola]